MKLACSSTAFDVLLRSGDLTQLEWLDLCAHELAADGAVFDVRHFPRTDTDYLAQLKKMAADLGLSVAALREDGFFSASAERMEQGLEMATALGAPLLSAPLPPETQASWEDVQQRLAAACSEAKRLNVTIALRNVPHTFAASTHDLKRVAKEADSAWLRFGPEFEKFEASDEPREVSGRCVLAWCDLASGPDMGLLAGFRGFLVLDDRTGSATAEAMKNALRAWRGALFEADRT